MLVDGGYNAFRSDLAEALQKMEIAHVKIMFNTHPHDDHIEGFLYLLDQGFTADEAMSPFAKEYNDKYNFQQKFVRKLDKAEMVEVQKRIADKKAAAKAELIEEELHKGDPQNA